MIRFCVCTYNYTRLRRRCSIVHAGEIKWERPRPGNFSLSAVDLISTWSVGIVTYSMRIVCITLLVCLYRYITYISYCSTHALLNPTVYRTASLSLRMDRRDNNNDVSTCRYLACVRYVI